MFPADEHPFLAAIAARPEDDEPRLVYADYLDETGSLRDAARAELIRIQIALHRMPPDDARRIPLAEREIELLEKHRPAWTAPLARLGARFQFRRGLPDSFSLEASTFLSRGEELFDNTPVGTGRSFVKRVRLTDAARVLPSLVACPLLQRIEELDLGDNDLGNGGAGLLASSSFIRNIRVLELGRNRLGDSGAAALAHAATLTKLESLALDDNAIGVEGVAAIAESPFLAGLIELNLTSNDVNEAGVRAIIRGVATRRLESLGLADNPLRDGLLELAGSTLFARLVRAATNLDLHRCGIEPSGAAALGASPAIRAVERLDLSENYLGDAGVAALARSGHLEMVRTLNLARNQIGDAGAAALLAAPLPRLEHLDLSNNRMTPRGVELVKAAARERKLVAIIANNGAEPVAAVPPPPPARAELDQVVELRRSLTYPARPGT